jgi:hypothetical protein
MLVRSHFGHRASLEAGISNLPQTEMERFFELPRLYQFRKIVTKEGVTGSL